MVMWKWVLLYCLYYTSVVFQCSAQDVTAIETQTDLSTKGGEWESTGTSVTSTDRSTSFNTDYPIPERWNVPSYGSRIRSEDASRARVNYFPYPRYVDSSSDNLTDPRNYPSLPMNTDSRNYPSIAMNAYHRNYPFLPLITDPRNYPFMPMAADPRNYPFIPYPSPAFYPRNALTENVKHAIGDDASLSRMEDGKKRTAATAPEPTYFRLEDNDDELDTQLFYPNYLPYSGRRYLPPMLPLPMFVDSYQRYSDATDKSNNPEAGTESPSRVDVTSSESISNIEPVNYVGRISPRIITPQAVNPPPFGLIPPPYGYSPNFLPPRPFYPKPEENLLTPPPFNEVQPPDETAKEPEETLPEPVAPAGLPSRIPYDYGFDMNDGNGTGQHRQESSDGSGTITGSYGYSDMRGMYREVMYIADGNGFRAMVKSNEPGVANPGSANVMVLAEPPPPMVVAEGFKKTPQTDTLNLQLP